MKTINKNEKGITLIALVITIIVLLLLAGVAISMLTEENGVLNRAGSAKTENAEAEEKESVELAVQSALLIGKGEIVSNEAYNDLNNELKKAGYEGEEITSLPNIVNMKYRKYKINKYGNVILESDTDNNYYFTFSEINSYILDAVKENVGDGATEEEINESLGEVLSELIDVGEIKEGETVALFQFPSEYFWKDIVGIDLASLYGVEEDEEFPLKNEEYTMYTSDTKSFTEYHSTSTNESDNIFIFVEDDDRIAIALAKNGDKFTALLNKGETDEDGNEDVSEIIKSWNEFLEKYGDIKFYFGKSYEISQMEDYYFTLKDLNDKGGIEIIEEDGGDIISIKDDIFWETIGKTFSGQYGGNFGYSISQKTLSTKEKDDNRNFKFTTEATTGKMFSFVELTRWFYDGNS